MLLRKIFVPKGEEVKGEWRKLHNEGLRDLHYSLLSETPSNKTLIFRPTYRVSLFKNSYTVQL
jgi:hypothetical protein